MGTRNTPLRQRPMAWSFQKEGCGKGANELINYLEMFNRPSQTPAIAMARRGCPKELSSKYRHLPPCKGANHLAHSPFGGEGRVRVLIRDHSSRTGQGKFLETGAARDHIRSLSQSKAWPRWMRFLPLHPLSTYS